MIGKCVQWYKDWQYPKQIPIIQRSMSSPMYFFLKVTHRWHCSILNILLIDVLETFLRVKCVMTDTSSGSWELSNVDLKISPRWSRQFALYMSHQEYSMIRMSRSCQMRPTYHNTNSLTMEHQVYQSIYIVYHSHWLSHTHNDTLHYHHIITLYWSTLAYFPC